MDSTKRVLLGTCFIALLLAAGRMKARTTEDAERKKIEAFNKRFVELHLKRDTEGISALWAESGVDLMPGHAPLIGRKKISAWREDTVSKMPEYKVTKQQMQFHDIQNCGEWTSKWPP